MNDLTPEFADRAEHRRYFCLRVSSIRLSVAVLIFWVAGHASAADEAKLRVATFDIDATPPLGYMMAYDPVIRVCL